MTTPQSRPVDLAGWQVTAALDGRLGAVVVPMTPQPPKGTTAVHMAENACVKGLPSLWLQPGFNQWFGKTNAVLPPSCVGDMLWGREAWAPCRLSRDSTDEYVSMAVDVSPLDIQQFLDGSGHHIAYKADGLGSFLGRWRPNRQMPEWASRLRFEVVGVRAVRVDQITPRNIVALCRGRYDEAQGAYYGFTSAGEQRGEIMQAFVEWWDSKHGKKHPYASNPWAWFVEIKRVEVKA